MASSFGAPTMLASKTSRGGGLLGTVTMELEEMVTRTEPPGPDATLRWRLTGSKPAKASSGPPAPAPAPSLHMSSSGRPSWGIESGRPSGGTTQSSPSDRFQPTKRQPVDGLASSPGPPSTLAAKVSERPAATVVLELEPRTTPTEPPRPDATLRSRSVGLKVAKTRSGPSASTRSAQLSSLSRSAQRSVSLDQSQTGTS